MSEVSKLKEIELFRNIDDKILKRLIPVLEKQHFKDGQIIFKEDDIGDEIYFILSGEVEIIKLVNKQTGECQPLSLLGKGEFFGEMALIDKSRRSATVRARTDVIVYRLGSGDFNKFLKTDTHIAMSILGSMLSTTVNRLRQMDVEFVTIYETGQLLAAEGDFDKILDGVLSKIMERLESAQRGFIAVWDEFSETFETQSIKGFEDKEQKGLVLKGDDAVIKWLIEHKERLVINDTSKTSVFGQRQLPKYCGRSFMAQPFIHRNKLLGFVAISNSSKEAAFTRSQINLLSCIAGQVGPVIDNVKKIIEEENRKRLQQSKIKREKTEWL